MMTASLPSLPGEYFQHTSRLPVAIDYPAALALRQMAAQLDDYPKYLLAPEVSALLHYIPDLYRKTLVDTLWNSGARINEALALGRTDFLLQPPIRSYSWPHSNNGPRNRRERQVVRPPAARLTGWYRFPM